MTDLTPTDLRQQPGVCPECGSELKFVLCVTCNPPPGPAFRTGQQPAQPDIETRIPTAAEVDERIGNVSSREYRSGFNDCRLVFAQPTIDRLQSALAAAQQDAGMWEREYRIEHGRVEQLTGELLAAQRRIADLESDLETERARGIHTCHDQCQRPLCVAGRRIRELEALSADLRARLNHSERLQGRYPRDAV